MLDSATFILQPRTWTAEEMVFINAARCPASMPEDYLDVQDDDDGTKTWMLLRLPVSPKSELQVQRCAPFDDYMALTKQTPATVHLPFGDIVMEDTPAELMTHYDFWKEARGSVLISGLGLGCILRAVASKECVTHVTCLELEPWVIGKVGPEFTSNPKVRILQSDALTWEPDRRFDTAWHDIYTEEGNGKALAMLHTRIMVRLEKKVGEQGAWNYPKQVADKAGFKWGRSWKAKAPTKGDS